MTPIVSIIARNRRTPATISEIDLSLIISRPNITHLEATTLLYYHDNFLLYIMKKYPALKSIKINQYEEDCYHVDTHLAEVAMQNNFSAAVIAKYIAYVNKIPYHRVCNFFTTANVGDILTSYWKLCGNITLELRYGNMDSEPYLNSWESTVAIDMMADLTKHFGNGNNGPAITYNPIGHNLPHLDVIEKTGNLINNLLFGIVEQSGKLESIIKARKQNTINFATGGFLDHLFKYCTNMSHLCVYRSRLLKCNTWCNLSTNRSITELTLLGCSYREPVLIEISERLPSSENLSILNCDIYENDSMQYPIMINITIDMPLTSLKTLFIKNSYEPDLDVYPTKTIVKLSTPYGTKYYKREPKLPITFIIREDIVSEKPSCFYKATKSYESEYDSGLYDNDTINFHIKCKSIDKLKIDLSFISLQLSFEIELEEEKNNPTQLLKPLFIQKRICDYFPHHHH